MSVATTTGPARGWYPDPKQPAALRWWDGSRWTGHRTAAREAAAGVLAAAESEPDTRRGTNEAFRAALESARATRAGSGSAPAVEPEPEPEPEIVATVVEPAPAPEPPAAAEAAPRRGRRKLAGAVAVLAVAGAGAALLATGGASAPAGKAAARSAAVAAADLECVKAWNQAESTDAAQLRVTLGQFAGAPARISRVAPLPGTLMQPNACALSVYDPGTGTHAIFVAGVKDQPGYLDVTTYPRAAKYGWPQTARQGNVQIQPDGTLRAVIR
jgi:hypothetical protein